MTGKELIIYILQYNLENEEMFEDGKFVGFIAEEEMAVKLETGVASVRAAYELGLLKGFRIGDKLYFLKSSGNGLRNRRLL